MSGYQTFEISEWEPFSRGIWYTLGSGDNDPFCWPGQLDYLGWVFEQWREEAYETTGNPFVGAPMFHTNKTEPLP